MNTKELVSRFQCVGCVLGSDPDTCSRYDPRESYGAYCHSHVLGTTINLAFTIALGLPKGFRRSTLDFSEGRDVKRTHSTLEIRLWSVGTAPDWDKFNVPVWAMEQDGFLYVRTLSPRTARLYTDVIEGGTLAMVPPEYDVIDVGEFYDDID